MAQRKFTELDFLSIKENLKTFLKSQKKFQDYDFDGSGLSILLDVLAYNTGYNAFYLNMLASEMFLDSAYMRDSVVSRAKTLGYLPSSRRGLRAEISVLFDFDDKGRSGWPKDPKVGFIIEKSDAFVCFVNNVRYVFNPISAGYVKPIGNKKYLCESLKLVEGKRLTYSWVVDSPTTQKFIIPNPNIDISTLVVSVKDSANSKDMILYKLHEDLTELGPTDAVYFLQETSSQSYEIIFGDGVIGAALKQGNVVDIEYIVPTNDAALGSDKFFIRDATVCLTADGIKIDKKAVSKITTISIPKDFSERETIESIKYKAPRLYEAQNRAVTKNDYEIILTKNLNVIEPKIQYLRVWGGEENSPPEYGKVFCAVKPQTGLALNTAEKLKLYEEFIRPKNLVSVQVEIVEPEYIGLITNTDVNFSRSFTQLSRNDIQRMILARIRYFRDTHLNGFDKDLRLSKLTAMIDAASSSIDSSITKVTMKYRITPTQNRKYNTVVKLFNPISRGDWANYTRSIKSSSFYFANSLVYLGDDGKGNLVLYRSNVLNTNSTLTNVGTVNYQTGELTIKNLVVEGIPGNLNYIDIFITPQKDDIIALRSQILILDDADIHINMIDTSTQRVS